MKKGYWIAVYRSVKDPDALSKYATMALPVIEGHGGRILARGKPSKAYEAGLIERVVVIEFDSVDLAIAAYESPDYQSMLNILSGAVERDIRIVEGV